MSKYRHVSERNADAVDAVREAIEQHRDEVVRSVVGDSPERDQSVLRLGAARALDALLARVEGKPWPPGG